MNTSQTFVAYKSCTKSKHTFLMYTKQALHGFNKRDLWLYYAEIINDELSTITESKYVTFDYNSTIHTLDNGDLLFLNRDSEILRSINYDRKGDYGADIYMLITDDPNYGDESYDEEDKKQHEMFNKVLTLKAVIRYIHADEYSLVKQEDIYKFLPIARRIYRYGEENAAKNIKREIDMNDVVIDDKYLLVCTEVDLSFGEVHIKGKLVENGSIVLLDLGETDQGWVFTMKLKVVDESLLRPPSDSNEFGGEEYEEAKSRFVRNQ